MNRRLRTALRRMAREDRRVREELVAAGALPLGSYSPAMAAVHRRNNDRMRAILAAHGWPGRTLVGDDGAEAAWLVVQHAVLAPDVQRRGLTLLRRAVRTGEAPAWQLAYLDDRVRMSRGVEQTYGTQFVPGADGRSLPWPIADAAGVDARRRRIGLPPLREHARRIRAEDAKLDWSEPRPRVGISACLLGHEVRWDGGHKRDPGLVAQLGRSVEWVPVCPEVELGLGVPREPIRLEGSRARPRLVGVGSRTDHTAAMVRLARARIAQLEAQGLSGYVLKSRSPTCGLANVAVHGPGGEPVLAGTGVFAGVLTAQLPLLPVEDEVRLAVPAARAGFLARVRAYARWHRENAAGMTRARLASFHEAHAALLREGLHRRLARLVSDRSRPIRVIARAYAAAFMDALRREETRPTSPRSPLRGAGRSSPPRRRRGSSAGRASP